MIPRMPVSKRKLWIFWVSILASGLPLAAKAQLASGVPQSELQPTVSYLLSTQNQNGGWGLTAGGASEVESTSIVLELLAQPRG